MTTSEAVLGGAGSARSRRYEPRWHKTVSASSRGSECRPGLTFLANSSAAEGVDGDPALPTTTAIDIRHVPAAEPPAC